MTAKIITTGEFVNHPHNEGVYLKHFFGRADNDRLNNVEVKIEPGCRIAPHVHDNSTEFFYIVSGVGEFLIDGQWSAIKPGDAMIAPQGEEHGLINTELEPLVIFSTFSPPIR
ncbi:MAG: cupin domain-containing protein [Deltaproteobacteria bacterium]|nr:cupin domain-containing protein [Deltaproteobacteria bacterium]